MAFFGVIEKYILGGRWSCIGRHKLPDGAKRGGGTTKIKNKLYHHNPYTNFLIELRGLAYYKKIKYNIASQPVHKLLMKCRGE